MIVVFHTIFLMIKKLRRIMQLPEVTEFQHEVDEECEIQKNQDLEQNLKFDPPVYRQRYGTVHDIFLQDKEIKKVVDFGCAEMGLFYFLRQLYSLEEVLEVDLDANLLSDYTFKVDPIAGDYMDKRSSPFTVHVLEGSISDPSPRLIGTDAVIAIEIIEHLYPDTLSALPYNIFNYVKPKIAIFTTPNADFNVLFPNFKGFRHYDHKFEWTREQFESWGENLAIRFPNYSVQFQGIGKGPVGTENLGCCSQMALFTRNSPTEDNLTESELPEESFGVCTYLSCTKTFIESMKLPDQPDQDDLEIANKDKYRLIKTVNFPVKVDDRTPEQKILDHFIYRINLSTSFQGMLYNEEEDRFEIPLSDLFFNQPYSCSFDEAKRMLQDAGYSIEELMVYDELTTCVIAEVKDRYSSRSSTPSLSDGTTDNHIQYDETFLESDHSDWGNP